MNRKIILAATLAGAAVVATPAMAWGWNKPKPKPSTSSSSGGSTSVPEPGMLGLMGASVAGLVLVRRRRKSS